MMRRGAWLVAVAVVGVAASAQAQPRVADTQEREVAADAGIALSLWDTGPGAQDVTFVLPSATTGVFVGTGLPGRVGPAALAIGYRLDVRGEPAAWVHLHQLALACTMRGGAALFTLGAGREESDRASALVSFGARVHVELGDSPFYVAVPVTADVWVTPFVAPFLTVGGAIGVETL